MSFTQTLQFGWIHPGLSQMWSMVVEVGFYVALPLVGLALWTVTKDRLRPGPVLAIIIGFGAIGPIWTVLSHQQDLLPVVSRLWSMAYFDWFAIGMLLAYGRKVGWRVNLAGSWVVSLALFLLATTTQVGPATLVPDDVNQALWKTTLYGLSAGAFVAPVALGAEVKWLPHPRPGDGLDNENYGLPDFPGLDVRGGGCHRCCHHSAGVAAASSYRCLNAQAGDG